ncbi:MAG: hypothetical protein ACNYWM_10550 [Methanosarcinales archaeon]|jgi:hypothetical protein
MSDFYHCNNQSPLTLPFKVFGSEKPHYRSIMEENVVAEPVDHENKDESEIMKQNMQTYRLYLLKGVQITQIRSVVAVDILKTCFNCY